MLLIFLLALLFQSPPAVSMTVETHNGSATIWLLNSDPRYEDFTLHIAGQPDIHVHAPMSEIQSVSLPICGQLDVVIEVDNTLFNRYQSTVFCRTYIPLVHGP